MCFQGQRQMDSESEKPWHKSELYNTNLTKKHSKQPWREWNCLQIHQDHIRIKGRPTYEALFGWPWNTKHTHTHTHTHKSHGSAGPFEDVNRNQAPWTWNLYILYHMVEFLLKWWSPNDPNAIFVLNHRNQKCWNSQKLKVWSLRVPPGSFRRLPGPCQSLLHSTCPQKI